MACLCALKIQTQLFSGGTVLNEFHLLTASECSHWRDVVLSASSHWKRRARSIDYYTLGAFNYLESMMILLFDTV